MFSNKQGTFSDGVQKMYYSSDLTKHSQISWFFSYPTLKNMCEQPCLPLAVYHRVHPCSRSANLRISAMLPLEAARK